MNERFPDTGRSSGPGAATDLASSEAGEGPPVLIVDADQRCVEANEPASRLLGLDRSQLVGRSLLSLSLPEGHLLVLPRIEDETDSNSLPTRVAKGDSGRRERRPSEREREVLGFLAKGLTDNQIAEQLRLSPATVQTHVRNAKAKLGARTRSQAVALALVGGLIEID